MSSNVTLCSLARPRLVGEPRAPGTSVPATADSWRVGEPEWDVRRGPLARESDLCPALWPV
eukprot:941016-Prymnesium_polylepis.1